MEITKNQYDMLSSICDVIKKEWGIGIGLVYPLYALIKKEDTFVLVQEFEGNPDLEDVYNSGLEGEPPSIYHFVNIGDLNFYNSGLEEVSDPPFEMNESAEEFFDRVNTALEEGELYFKPSITTTIDGNDVHITKLTDGSFAVTESIGYGMGMFTFKREDLDGTKIPFKGYYDKESYKKIVDELF